MTYEHYWIMLEGFANRVIDIVCDEVVNVIPSKSMSYSLATSSNESPILASIVTSSPSRSTKVTFTLTKIIRVNITPQ